MHFIIAGSSTSKKRTSDVGPKGRPNTGRHRQEWLVLEGGLRVVFVLPHRILCGLELAKGLELFGVEAPPEAAMSRNRKVLARFRGGCGSRRRRFVSQFFVGARVWFGNRCVYGGWRRFGLNGHGWNRFGRL